MRTRSLSRRSVSSNLKLPRVNRVIQREVHVVIQIRAGGNDPVHETRLDQRDDAGAAEAGRRQRAGDAHADGHIGVEHAVGEKLAGFLEPRGVVGEENLVDDVGQLFLAGEVFRHDAFARHVFLLVRAMFFLHPLRHFGNVFAGANVLFSVLAIVQKNNWGTQYARGPGLPITKLPERSSRAHSGTPRRAGDSPASDLRYAIGPGRDAPSLKRGGVTARISWREVAAGIHGGQQAGRPYLAARLYGERIS